MYRKLATLSIVIAICLLAGARISRAQQGADDIQSPDAALGSAFTYQGRLTQAGAPVDGAIDFEFYLFDAASGGTQVGGPISINDKNLADGYFTVLLDFGTSVFKGQSRFLEVRVRAGSETGDFTIMAPRQELTASPYAQYALTGPFWRLNGNSATSPGTNYLGTSDNKALELRVNGIRALRIEPKTNAPNLIGGFQANSVTSGVYGATLFGGGTDGTTDYPNRVTDHYGTVGGGFYNQAGNDNGTFDDAWFATVSGGEVNWATGAGATIAGGVANEAFGNVSTIGGGSGNTASSHASTVGGGGANNASGDFSTVGGGEYNTASGDDASVSGGSNNTASDDYAHVGGGFENSAAGVDSTICGGYQNQTDNHFSTVGGGEGNKATRQSTTVGGGEYNEASGTRATVGGGMNNIASGYAATISGGQTNTASGDHATIPGGSNNNASGDFSFAAGRKANAQHTGAFIWADSNDFTFSTAGTNTFRARATGGFRLVTGIDDNGAITWSCRLLYGETWSCSSDRSLKENFQPVDSQAVLAKVISLPVQTWNAIGADPATRHLGPTAQDFYAAFGLGDDQTLISTIDLDGVALVAIQGLHQQLQDQALQIGTLQQQNTALANENASLRAQLDGIEARLAALEQRGAAGIPTVTSPAFSGFGFLGLVGLGFALVIWRRKAGQS